MADNFLLIIYREGEDHSHRSSLFIQETTKTQPIIRDMVNYEFLNRKTVGFSPLYELHLFNSISSAVSSRLLARIEEAEELDQKQKMNCNPNRNMIYIRNSRKSLKGLHK